MNDDLISRQAAIDTAKKLLDYYGTNDISKEFADHTAERFMNRVPSAQPERKKGKWIRTGRTNIYGGYELECPVCGDKVMVQNIEYELYCRNCGARMDEE